MGYNIGVMKKNIKIIIILICCAAAVMFLKDILFPVREIQLDQTHRTFVINGDARVKSSGAEDWQKVTTSTTFKNGDVIETGTNSTVDIIIGPNCEKAVKIKGNSHVELEGINPTRINCTNGMVLATLEKLEPKSSFVVRTPMGISGARGTGWSVEATADRTAICVFDNNVYAIGADAGGRKRGKEFTITEGTRRIIFRDKAISDAQAIENKDIVYWKYWSKNIAYLRDGKILVNDFDTKEYFNNLGGVFGVWNVFYGDLNQSCLDELVPSDRAKDAGYCEKLIYDVDSPYSAYNGFFTKLLDIDITDYKYLVLYIKGDKEAGFTTRVNLELKNGRNQVGKASIDDITDQ